MTVEEALKTMPKEIVLGPHTWEVRSEEINPGQPKVFWGMTDRVKGTIIVSPICRSAEMVAGILLHEIAHAAYFTYAPMKIKSEEDFALSFETTSLVTFFHNPGLLQWLHKVFK